MEKSTVTAGGSITAAVFASLCCIGPVFLGSVGVGSIGAFVVFEQYRTVFIVMAALFIAFAFSLAYRRHEVHCEDGTCKLQSSSRRTKLSVWGAAVVVTAAIAFPYFGIAPALAMSKTFVDSPLKLEDNISFLKVPLVCNAAPNIGCGSKSKFIMLELMNEPPVKEAWLNRRGTVMALVWKENANAPSREQALKTVFSKHSVPVEQVPEQELAAMTSAFRAKDEWFKGSDVDALSKEEAGIIADQILARISPHVRFKRSEDKMAFHKDVQAIIERCFLSIKSYQELNDAMNQNVRREVVAAGEKYLGKGNMPDMQFQQSACEHGNTGGDCCATDSKGKKQ